MGDTRPEHGWKCTKASWRKICIFKRGGNFPLGQERSFLKKGPTENICCELN